MDATSVYAVSEDPPFVDRVADKMQTLAAVKPALVRLLEWQIDEVTRLFRREQIKRIEIGAACDLPFVGARWTSVVCHPVLANCRSKGLSSGSTALRTNRIFAHVVIHPIGLVAVAAIPRRKADAIESSNVFSGVDTIRTDASGNGPCGLRVTDHRCSTGIRRGVWLPSERVYLRRANALLPRPDFHSSCEISAVPLANLNDLGADAGGHHMNEISAQSRPFSST